MLTLSSKMFNLVLILCVVLLSENVRSIEISSYARVSKNGDSISTKSYKEENHGIDLSSSHMSHIESTSIDKPKNEALKQGQFQMQQRNTSSDDNVEEVMEKSEGRAIKSNYYFPLSDFLTKAKAMQSNSYKNEKEGRLIVYPSYTQNIDQTRRRYDMAPSTGQVAQRRYAPGEAYGVTGYKLKHPEKFSGYKYQSPPKPAPPVMMMPQMQTPPIQMPPPSPPKPMMTDSMPPVQQYLPPSKFRNPIVVADITETTPIMTVKPSHFLPTISPVLETSSINPIIDLLSFNKVNTSYMPPELQAIKDSIDNNHVVVDELPKNDIELDTAAYADLHRFPSNINSMYLPQNEMPQDPIEEFSSEDLYKFPPNINSSYTLDSYMQPTPFSANKNTSKIDDSKKEKINKIVNGHTQAAIDLHKFPPNINASYLPPEMTKFMNLHNSYIPPASGQQNDKEPTISDDSSIDPVESSDSVAPNQSKNVNGINDIKESGKATSVAPYDLHKFPPNINSAYLPPEMMKFMNLYSSYLPPESGQSKDIKGGSSDKIKAVATEDLSKFPPIINSAYLPPEMMKFMNLYNSYLPPASGQPTDRDPQSIAENDSSNMMYLPPKDLNNFPPNIHSYYLPPEMMKQLSLINSYLPPASGDPSQNSVDLDLSPPPLETSFPNPNNVPSMMNQQAVNGGMQMNHGYTYKKPSTGDDSFMMKPQPPPMDMMMASPAPMDMMMMSGPSGPSMDDHSHHHHDHPWDSYPDVIYDDHHHHHDHHVEETTTTEAPAEPRVKKYSYYYLGRKLWYIPLYFTFWFCLYVAALIIRSIGRHKVDLPNHYVQRSLHDMSHQELVEKINKMTEFTMSQIEDFKNKYL